MQIIYLFLYMYLELPRQTLQILFSDSPKFFLCHSLAVSPVSFHLTAMLMLGAGLEEAHQHKQQVQSLVAGALFSLIVFCIQMDSFTRQQHNHVPPRYFSCLLSMLAPVVALGKSQVFLQPDPHLM